MSYTNIRGVDHYYEWIRESSASTEKPVMVFLHGWGGSTRYWQNTAEALSPWFHCLLYDLRGFGRSRLPQENHLDYELETYADDLAILLENLNLEEVYINAHSMGASIATLFLNRYRERVRKAILTCSGIFAYDEKAFTVFHKAGTLVAKFRPQWLRKIPQVDRLFISRFLHRPLPRHISQAFLEDYLMADEEATIGTIYTSVSKKAAEIMPDEFSKISIPTLLVSGEYDKIIPAKMGAHAASFSEKVYHLVMPRTAHFPMLEDKDTYLRNVKEFLEIQPAS
ncbi:alpha/beta hydrolase [Geitlerinema sp. PCC 9228]|uniref:alpha/beta fold hydrolase n=1 Tax=Geitlerinema sp. PCC 9228 TaxID=111611 RepID=UPI0008F9AA46|nr:alpha/beta hydrolase [Geitlerinema sp. PCC 9228]